MAPTFFSTGTVLLALSASTLLSTVSASSHHNHAYLHNGRRHQLQAKVEQVEKRAPAPVAGWEDFGCYTDSVQSRTLYGAGVNDPGMTPAFCINYCAQQGFPLAGVEYANECYCGKSFSIASSKANQTICNFPCAGDNTQSCGGNAAINVYHNTADKTPLSPPVINAGVNGFGYAGCYVDSVQKRSLPTGGNIPNGAKMTIAACTLACSNQGFQWAGTEYAGECYCGNTLPDSALAPDGEKNCNMACNGNSTEICGGPDRLSVYHKGARSKIAPIWPSIGCYTDSVQQRTFRYAVNVPGGAQNMTGPACQVACQAGGYTYAGTEYAQECWCDTQINNAGAPAADGCNMACKGDPSTVSERPLKGHN